VLVDSMQEYSKCWHFRPRLLLILHRRTNRHTTAVEFCGPSWNRQDRFNDFRAMQPLKPEQITDSILKSEACVSWTTRLLLCSSLSTKTGQLSLCVPSDGVASSRGALTCVSH
jgi:hypothetical protein